MGYSYYDSPDGQDCEKKLFYLVKKAGITGLFLSSGYVLLVETPPTYAQILGRFARITAPCVAAAAAGAVSICMLVGARNVDDHLNHLYGGFAAGVAGGLARGHFGHGIFAGIFIGGFAAAYKTSRIKGYDIHQVNKFKYNTDDFWSKDYDWRITKPRPKEWIAAPPK